MLKNKQGGGDGFFRYLSKKAVRPLGFKKIRTSTGVYKSFSRSARGKTELLRHSSKNLKQSKIDNLKLKLKSTTNSSSIMKLNSKISNIESKLEKKINTIGKKVSKAQANLTKKLKKYTPKHEKYSRIMQKKIYKSVSMSQ